MSEKLAAIYIRVSDKDQNHRSQVPDLDRWVTAHPEETVTWFKDTYTGKCMSRPGWDKLWADVETGRIGKIVVWKLDRLGRYGRGLLNLFHALSERKVNLLATTQPFELETPQGRAMAGMLAIFSEFELEIRSERQRAGIDAIRELHGGKCPWGGGVVGHRKIRFKGDADKILRLRRSGFGFESIAEMTGYGYRTVRRFCREAIA